MLFSYPLMVAIQVVSARIGRTTGRGIAGNIRRHYPNWLLQSIVVLLLIANTINIGADLGAMADAVRMLAGGPHLLYVALFGLLCAVLQVFTKYGRYAALLRWLTLALLAYFGTVMVVRIPWAEAARGLLIPTFAWDSAFWTTVVAILGTTISPYLFFWQAAQEVEDIRAVRERKPLIKAPEQGNDAIERIRFDTYVGMALSNLVALAIIVTTAATRLRARQPRRCDPWLVRLPSHSLRWELWGPVCLRCRCWRDRPLTPSARRGAGRWGSPASRCRQRRSTSPSRSPRSRARA